MNLSTRFKLETSYTAKSGGWINGRTDEPRDNNNVGLMGCRTNRTDDPVISLL